MTKKQEFIKYVEDNLDFTNMSDNARFYWEAFCGVNEEEKPMFTDNGKLIMRFLQNTPNPPMWKARDIAEGLFIASRSVSGAMRKLVDDGFVEKVGQNPTVYALTEKGKNIVIED